MPAQTDSQPFPLPTGSPLSPSLAVRGQRALGRPPLLKCALFQNQFDPANNPDGLINLGVAENSLMTSYLMDFLAAKQFKFEYLDFTYGSALGGSVRFFAALQHLTSTYFGARTPVLREHVIAGSGCGSVIDLLVSCLADEGDGILVANPRYNGFEAAFQCRNGVHPVGVDLDEGCEMNIDAIPRFEEALLKSDARGIKIRAIMLCNPHNPLGFCYSKEVLLAYCAFAQKHDLHLISDEIYALSTYASRDTPEAQSFVSVLSLDPLAEAGCDPARVHVVYGSSKDWGLNGLRVGALISQANPSLHVAMESSCLLMKMSSAADIVWSGLLLDPVALPAYIDENRRRLAAAYERATNFLRVHDIPYRAATAGHFIFVDLRRFLPTHSAADGRLLAGPFEREEELAARLAAHGVNLARGTAYAYSTPGWFRLTFTLRPDYFEQGITRLERCLGLVPTVPIDVIEAKTAITMASLTTELEEKLAVGAMSLL